MKTIDTIIKKIASILSIVGFASLIIIMFLITIDVLMRKIIDVAIPGSYEIVERLLLLLVFASFAYGQTNRSHIHVTMFVSKFPRPVGMALFGIFSLLSFIGCALMAYALVLQGQYAFTAGTWTPVLQIPLYPFFYIAAVCSAVFAITILWDAIKSLVGIGSKEWADDIASTWD